MFANGELEIKIIGFLLGFPDAQILFFVSKMLETLIAGPAICQPRASRKGSRRGDPTKSGQRLPLLIAYKLLKLLA